MKKQSDKSNINSAKDIVGCKILLCVAAAIMPLMLCSKSSPLYPFNDWPDINIFFTMGKGMLRGSVPYVDLLDQKGPYIFFIAGIGYLCSKTSFYGLFVFECLSLFFFVYYAWKTMCIYVKDCPVWILPLLTGAIVSSKSFVHGGSIEELSLGISAYAVYSLLRFLRQDEREGMPVPTLLWNGIWAGVLFWSKYTLMGLYLAWISVVLAECLLRRKRKAFFVSAGVFLAGMLLMTVPWMIYFGWHHAINDWLKVYIWDNIFGYSSNNENSLLSKMLIAILNALRSLKDRGNWGYSLPMALGCIGYICLPGRIVSLKEKISTAWMGLGLSLGIFIGGTKHDYYGLPLAVFVIFTGGVVSIFGDWLSKKWKWLQGKYCRAALFLTAFAIALIGAFSLSPNVYLMSVKRNDMPQYRFAEQILASEDTTILNYGFLDGGFYTVLDQVPVVPDYCILNIDPQRQLAQQNTYVEQQLTQWVVTWKAFPLSEEELKELPVISEYYDLTDYQYFYFEGDIRTYALYERKTE